MAKSNKKNAKSAKETAPQAASQPVKAPIGVARIPKFSFPKKIAVNKQTLIKVGIGVLIVVIAVPLLDLIIQLSITSQYAAFYKGQNISRQEYISKLEQQDGSTVIQSMITSAAILEAAKEKNITLSDAEITAAVNQIKQQNGITTDAQYQQALAQANLTDAQLREGLKPSLLINKLVPESQVTPPTEAEMQSEYANNKTTTYKNLTYANAKSQIQSSLEQSAWQTLQNQYVTNLLKNYDSANVLTSADSRAYGFLKSIDLVKRLIANQ